MKKNYHGAQGFALLAHSLLLKQRMLEEEEKSLDGTYTKIQRMVKYILQRQGLIRW